MEQDTILDHMAKYDFTSPINVTMVFEDSDADSDSTDNINLTDENSSRINENTTSENLIIYVEDEDTVLINGNKETEKIDSTRKSDKNKNNTQNKLPVNTRKRKSKNAVNNNKVSTIKGNEAQDPMNRSKCRNNCQLGTCDESNRVGTPNVEKTTNKTQPQHQRSSYEQIDSHIKSMLGTLSEHILSIMEAYIQMQRRKRSLKDSQLKIKTEAAYIFVKEYFLNLSYSTLVSLILPQLKDTKFITSFIDDVVKMAIDRKYAFKCDRRDVHIIFDQIVQWAQEKKNHVMKRLHENSMLRQQLNQPPKNITNNVTCQSQAPINTCVFSSGPPGRELTISIDSAVSNSLRTQALRSSGNSRECNEYNNNSIPSYETNHSKTNYYIINRLNGQAIENSNNLQANRNVDPSLVSRPPPSYNSAHNIISNYYQQPPEHRRDLRTSLESIENYFTTDPYYGGPNIMNGTRSEERLRPTSDVFSLNQDPSHAFKPVGSCHLCGKCTQSICHGCYYYYCSNICEQLDLLSHKAVCQKAYEQLTR